jgi:hypothetical protein
MSSICTVCDKENGLYLIDHKVYCGECVKLQNNSTKAMDNPSFWESEAYKNFEVECKPTKLNK